MSITEQDRDKIAREAARTLNHLTQFGGIDDEEFFYRHFRAAIDRSLAFERERYDRGVDTWSKAMDELAKDNSQLRSQLADKEQECETEGDRPSQ